MIEAITAILVCKDEVFAIQRQPHLRAFPGYHAFPGGKIEADDEFRRIEHPLVSRCPRSHITALHRELSEELDFDLAGAIMGQSVREISLFGTAVTPAFESIRFSAYYYKIVLNEKPDFSFDVNEIAEGGWQTATVMCEQYSCGQALMVVPMRNTLLELARDISATCAEPFNVVIPVDELACLELIDGLRTIPVPSNTLPPATTTNALLLGDKGQRQVLVDPSPKSEEVYRLLANTLSYRPVDVILITHHHPDHHERAMDMACEKDVPVLISCTTLEHLNASFGEEYYKGLELEIISEGSEITRWKGEPVRVYELPGHDDGMVGLAPDNLAWFFVADLAQTMGSIVIPDDGGDLVDYLASLTRVINLQPDVVLPSHGIPSGGTELLKRTLQHRLDRENQIRPLFQAGAGTDDILGSVYPELDEGLKSLAIQTIHQHIRNLKAEAN